LRESLEAHDHAVGEAERKLAEAEGAESEAAARAALDDARRRRGKTLEAIRRYDRQLGALNDAAEQERFRRPTGRVEPLCRPPHEEAAMGIVKPTARRAVLPHRVQVWPLPAADGKRAYTVAMAHPEAGRFGSFVYVAYADTDADGLPDRLIARSPAAIADSPGQWTRWTFTTSSPSVFVGNAWWDASASAYCHRTPPRPDNWRGLGTDLYVAPVPGAVPRRRWAYWPYISNIRIRVNQNPDAFSQSGPEMIVR
jgi:hypothetical protein